MQLIVSGLKNWDGMTQVCGFGVAKILSWLLRLGCAVGIQCGSLAQELRMFIVAIHVLRAIPEALLISSKDSLLR